MVTVVAVVDIEEVVAVVEEPQWSFPSGRAARPVVIPEVVVEVAVVVSTAATEAEEGSVVDLEEEDSPKAHASTRTTSFPLPHSIPDQLTKSLSAYLAPAAD
jgi:hypothetical protein